MGNKPNDTAKVVFEGLRKDLDELAPNAFDADFNKKSEAWNRMEAYLNERINVENNGVHSDGAIPADICGLIGFCLTTPIARAHATSNRDGLFKWLDRLSAHADRALAAIPSNTGVTPRKWVAANGFILEEGKTYRWSGRSEGLYTVYSWKNEKFKVVRVMKDGVRIEDLADNVMRDINNEYIEANDVTFKKTLW